MGANWPNFNEMIESQLPWTIATDFNPNNQILSLPFIGSCLVQRCNVDPLAALAACTINAGFTTPHNSIKARCHCAWSNCQSKYSAI